MDSIKRQGAEPYRVWRPLIPRTADRRGHTGSIPVQFANLNTMTKAQMAKALAKTQATIQQVTIEAEQAARADRQRIIAENCQRAREEKKEREFRKWLRAKEVEWEAARAKERRKAELFEEWQRLSDRYDRLYTDVCKFSDAAIRQFEQAASTKGILNRIKQIDAEYAAIK